MVLLTLKDSEKNPKTKAGEGDSSGLEEYTRPGQKLARLKVSETWSPHFKQFSLFELYRSCLSIADIEQI